MQPNQEQGDERLYYGNFNRTNSVASLGRLNHQSCSSMLLPMVCLAQSDPGDQALRWIIKQAETPPPKGLFQSRRRMQGERRGRRRYCLFKGGIMLLPGPPAHVLNKQYPAAGGRKRPTAASVTEPVFAFWVIAITIMAQANTKCFLSASYMSRKGATTRMPSREFDVAKLPEGRRRAAKKDGFL
ncbi:hypothetical protein CH063_10675 [Colletotrichum higginsianum]|uniref:Uncharacterized protein n=1 Tax=Colletotrichum higginsianum (strain IMI 349063) TaxID=759273 RepID=H1VID4_COLHI|nr:hypothetical protein CH063_10675 [Colletotrichum higginsianum]